MSCCGAPHRCSIRRPRINIRTGATSVGAAPRAEVIEMGAALWLLHHRGRLRLRYPLPGVPSAAAGGNLRPTAPSISAHSRNRSAPGCGWVTWWCPSRCGQAVCAEKSLLNSGNPWLEQATLADFMHSGSYVDESASRPLAQDKENRDSLVAALRRNFGDVQVDGRRAEGCMCSGICRRGSWMPWRVETAGAAGAGRRVLAVVGAGAFPAANLR